MSENKIARISGHGHYDYAKKDEKKSIPQQQQTKRINKNPDVEIIDEACCSIPVLDDVGYIRYVYDNMFVAKKLDVNVASVMIMMRVMRIMTTSMNNDSMGAEYIMSTYMDAAVNLLDYHFGTIMKESNFDTAYLEQFGILTVEVAQSLTPTGRIRLSKFIEAMKEVF